MQDLEDLRVISMLQFHETRYDNLANVKSESHWPVSLLLSNHPDLSASLRSSSRFPFHSCHRHLPSLSNYTWLNIGPQMIIKPTNPQACKNLGRGALHRRLLPPPCTPCFLDSHPVWKHGDRRGHTACLFLFWKSSIPRPHLSDLCFYRFTTEAESERERKQREGWLLF